MPAGRPPKSPKAKRLSGNPGRRKLAKDPPQPRQGAPTCPTWLSAEAKKEWKRLVPELQTLGLLTIVDLAALSSYCQAWAELQEATRILDRDGRIIEVQKYNRAGDVTGYAMQTHPAVKLQRDAFQRVKQFLCEFGLSPASRSRTAGQGKGGDQTDPFEQYLNGKASKKT